MYATSLCMVKARLAAAAQGTHLLLDVKEITNNPPAPLRGPEAVEHWFEGLELAYLE